MDAPVSTQLSDSRLTRLVLDNDVESLSALVQNLRAWLVDEGIFDESESLRLTGAVDEALQNACFHGNLELDSALREGQEDRFHALAEERRTQSPYRDRRIRFSMEVAPEEVRVTIADEGPGFDVDALPDPTAPESLCREHGRGILLMRAFTDDVTFSPRGNRVTLVKRRSTGGGAKPR